MRITARESAERDELYTVLLDGRDVTNVATLADDVIGEVALFPYKTLDDGRRAIDENEMVRRDREGLPPVDVLHGKVELICHPTERKRRVTPIPEFVLSESTVIAKSFPKIDGQPTEVGWYIHIYADGIGTGARLVYKGWPGEHRVEGDWYGPISR